MPDPAPPARIRPRRAPEPRALEYLEEANGLRDRMRTVEDESRAEVADLGKDRRRLWLLANRAGATYRAITASSGMSEARVCQEIRLALSEWRDEHDGAEPAWEVPEAPAGPVA